MRGLRKPLTAVVVLAATIIAGWEGKSNKAYLDLVQVPTICYGTTRNVKLGDVKTDAECTQLLHEEVQRIDAFIHRNVKVPLQPHTKAAMISFTYNVGDTAFLRSNAFRLLNAGRIKDACEALATRDYSTGVCRGYGCGWAQNRMVRGLQNRRLDERSLCLGEKK